MPHDLDAIRRQTRHLARIILVAAIVNGGSITREELRPGWRALDWRPTRGEVTDAFKYLVHHDKANISGPDYIDSGSTRITVKTYTH